MLLQLSVRNLVLIESLAFELAQGFNVLTGETGAGKSIIIDALNLVLGGRARPDVVRSGAREAEVEALFELAPNSRAVARLEAAGVPCDPQASESGDRRNDVVELVIRRVVQAEGRSRAYLNGRMCTASQLAELAPELCDIASQHESVSLTDPATHGEYLDAFGHLESERDSLAIEVDGLFGVVRELEKAVDAERGRAEREDLIAFQLREIEELDPKADEEALLEQERGRLRHASKLADVTRGSADRLYEGEGAICDSLLRIVGEIEGAAEIDGSLSAVARNIESARSELADAARELSRYAEGIEANPERLAEVEERLFRLQKLLRKHGPTTAELLQHRESLVKERDTLSQAGDRITLLEQERNTRTQRVTTKARSLSKKRREAADKLADAIGRELAQLGMGRARVIVDVTHPVAPGAAVSIDGARLTRAGLDHVEFLIAPNRGEDPRPLRKIASGGELSRALLALKRVLADQGPASTYIFDEVDAGVGGAVAEVIGHAIADIGRHRQVLAITHLAQIAALADTHFVVDKAEAKGRTHTRLKRLAETERVEEIARMIGGMKIGEAAKRAAHEMLISRQPSLQK